MNLHDWEKHILNTKNTTWCGLPVAAAEWCFIDLDHAVINSKNGGRLTACPQCLDAAKNFTQRSTRE